eukprot:CAMPEP_0113285486 /NCGR_PEP_ID=MMETSP0008_2-20120614/30608_1 /TAXON_ID=97485 /ORGANISM="Prymnesium parvum" /LENGTH=118 /DNA_ID=CAMNT_0000136469 /DNA_START=308 /DNA_END=661 /DNA_ORIENTATION=- /assembly_acc=CAM_ASM_000153
MHHDQRGDEEGARSRHGGRQRCNGHQREPHTPDPHSARLRLPTVSCRVATWRAQQQEVGEEDGEREANRPEERGDHVRHRQPRRHPATRGLSRDDGARDRDPAEQHARPPPPRRRVAH